PQASTVKPIDELLHSAAAFVPASLPLPAKHAAACAPILPTIPVHQQQQPLDLRRRSSSYTVVGMDALPASASAALFQAPLVSSSSQLREMFAAPAQNAAGGGGDMDMDLELARPLELWSTQQLVEASSQLWLPPPPPPAPPVANSLNGGGFANLPFSYTEAANDSAWQRQSQDAAAGFHQSGGFALPFAAPAQQAGGLQQWHLHQQSHSSAAVQVVYDTQFIDARSSALAAAAGSTQNASVSGVQQQCSLGLLRSPTSLLPHWPEQEAGAQLTLPPALSLDRVDAGANK
ncbi:hypothetical protein GGI00_005135, partial [Coemansia sp. RSA 2681]